MRLILSAFLIIVASLSAYSQAVKDLFSRNVDAHIDVVPLVFPDPSVRFGSELKLGNRWSAGLNLGVGIAMFKGTSMSFFSEPSWKKGYRLYEARPEIKFYWLKSKRMGWYIAAEGFVMSMKGSAGKSYHFTDATDTLVRTFDQADYQKTKLGAIGKIGGRFLLAKRITLDFFNGIGLSNTNSSYSRYVNPGIRKSDPFFEGENYTVGKRVTAHLSFGFRLGMILWNRKEQAAPFNAKHQSGSGSD